VLYRVKGDSMNPTLLDGDRLWATSGEIRVGQIVIARVHDIVMVGDTAHWPERLIVKRVTRIDDHPLRPVVSLRGELGGVWDVYRCSVFAVVRAVVWPPHRWLIDITSRAC
jgi:hypothetical protein